ncbi:MAG: division/cell wall cluster transcriptional repressor MraZ [Paludibacteraceae bacterium]
MSTFIGKFEAKADVKGRIFIPATYRKILPEGERDRLVMRKDADTDCLIIYPENVWNKKMEELKTNLDEWNADDQLLLMQFVSDAEWLDVDTQGRVLISRRFLDLIGIENNEVMFVGMMDRFAVWGRKRYDEAKLTPNDFAKRLKAKMQARSDKQI